MIRSYNGKTEEESQDFTNALLELISGYVMKFTSSRTLKHCVICVL